MYQNPDFHMHSSFSDGSDTPAELIENVKRAGIDIFSLTDHDTYDGCAEVKKRLRPGDPVFLGGIELSCEDDLGKYHVLGYCYDVKKESIRNAVQITHEARRRKAKNRILYLEDVCHFYLTEEEKEEILHHENPGKPHFAALMVEKGFVKDKKEAFEILGGYHEKERRLTPAEAIDAVLSADGIPVLAHGILADGSKNLTEAEIRQRIERLKPYGLMGLECYYSTFTEEQKEIMLRLADEYHLLVTAGSDYHGKNKTIPLGTTNSPDPERMTKFYRAIEFLLGIDG